MPITHRAIKKLRHDRIRTVVNQTMKKKVKEILKATRTSPTAKALSKSYQALDKAAKHNSIHPNKAARLKSRLSLLKKK